MIKTVTLNGDCKCLSTSNPNKKRFSYSMPKKPFLLIFPFTPLFATGAPPKTKRKWLGA